MANELTVVNEQERGILLAVVGGRLAQEIEFTQLDNAIEKIAAHTHDMSDNEREGASNLIDKFEERVVVAINNKTEALNGFASALKMTPNVSYDTLTYRLKEYGQQIHAVLVSQGVTELDKELTKIEETIEKIKEYKEENEPEAPFADIEVMSPIEVAELKMEHEMAMAKFKNEVHKKEYVARRMFHDFQVAARKDKKIKRFIKILNEQAKAADQARAIVAEKAEAAKMAILIGDADIREALKEFHDFATTAL